jgi:hypothetical protein
MRPISNWAPNLIQDARNIVLLHVPEDSSRYVGCYAATGETTTPYHAASLLGGDGAVTNY